MEWPWHKVDSTLCLSCFPGVFRGDVAVLAIFPPCLQVMWLSKAKIATKPFASRGRVDIKIIASLTSGN